MVGYYRSLKLLKNVSNSCYPLKNGFRNYSRRVSNADSSYKPVKPRRSLHNESSQLVWRDPSFELLTSNQFPLFLRGNIGLAWYDANTTIKTHHELILEQIDDDIDDTANGNMLCRVQSCPTVLRKTVKDLFPYRNVDDLAELSVISISLKPDTKLMRKNKELETEKLAQTFLIAARNICDRLRKAGFWADFINPFSGRPYFAPTSSTSNELYDTDEKFRCLDFQIFEIKDCKVVSNDADSQKTFVGSLFTNAPCKKNELNTIFTA